jgi:hypothetical protein
MSDEDDKLILRMLREIRREQAAQRTTMQAIEGGIAGIERNRQTAQDRAPGPEGSPVARPNPRETNGRHANHVSQTSEPTEARIEKPETKQ